MSCEKAKSQIQLMGKRYTVMTVYDLLKIIQQVNWRPKSPVDSKSILPYFLENFGYLLL